MPAAKTKGRRSQSEIDKVVLASKEAGPSRTRPSRSVSAQTLSIQADSDYDARSPPPMETQFRSQGEDSDDQLWEADCILDERGETAKGEYLVKWVGFDPATGENWEPTWERRDGVTPQLAKEWKARKKIEPDIVGVEGKRLVAEQKRKKEEMRRKKHEARLAKSKKTKGKATPRTSVVVDFTQSRSSTADAAHIPNRSTKRSSQGASEREGTVARARTSEPPVSTSSINGVLQVVLPLRTRTSAGVIESLPENQQNVAEGSPSSSTVANHDEDVDDGDGLMEMYTNGDQLETDFMGGRESTEGSQGATEAVESELKVGSSNKRSAPASSTPVNGNPKRVRTAAPAAESSSAGSSGATKAGDKHKIKSIGTTESTKNGMKYKDESVVESTSLLTKIVKVESFSPVHMPTDSEFRELLRSAKSSSQSSGSTGAGQSQPDPIRQFSSPARDSLNKSRFANAGHSSLAKSVRIRMINGEEVLAVDSDSEAEGGSEPEQSEDINRETEIVDDILATSEMSPAVQEESFSAPSETRSTSSPLERERLVEDTIAALKAPKEDSAISGTSVARPRGSTEDENSRVKPSSTTVTPAELELQVATLQQMIVELNAEKFNGWQRNEEPQASGTVPTKVKGPATELAKHFAVVIEETKEIAPASTMELEPRTDSFVAPANETSDIGLQTDSIPVVRAVVTADIAQQTDSMPVPTPITVSDTGAQTYHTPITAPFAGTDVAAQTDSIPVPSAINLTSLEDQLTAKDADRKKWRIRAKRAEGEVTTLQEDLQFIRAQYQEASASAVREVLKSTDLDEKMTILQGQLKHGLKQRELHYTSVKGQQDKQVTILVAQNKILLEQSRRTDDEVRSKAAAYHEVETQREKLEQLLRNAMRKIDNLSDRNDELVSQIEVLRAKQMGVLRGLDDESGDEEYSYNEESEAETSASPSPSPLVSQSEKTTQSTEEFASIAGLSASVYAASAASLNASQLMPDTQDLLSAEQSLESESNRQKRLVRVSGAEGNVRNGSAYSSPWADDIFYPNESAIKEHLMNEVDRGFS